LGSGSRRRNKKKKRNLFPIVLVSLAAGSLITLAAVYSPAPDVVGAAVAGVEGMITQAAIYSPSWSKIEHFSLPSLFNFNSPGAPSDTILIEVRNGAGVSNLAMEAQRYFETRTGDVTYIAPGQPVNASEMDYSTTVILSRDTSYRAAMEVAGVLGLGDTSVVMLLPPPGQISPVDVTIILGRDRNASSYFIPYRD
jgi:hypothetical protein